MIEVWRVDVRRAPSDLARLLSADEAARAGRFRFDRDRRSFVTTRALLRTLAASYLDVAPEEVVFTYGGKGKPAVTGLSFNVSHAGDVALAAFARSGRVGVDVEMMRPDVEMLALARRFFTPTETAALERLSGDDLVRGFYRCWTCKEAFVKAVGEGLSFDLDRVEVAVYPEPPELTTLDGRAEAALGWTLREVDAGSGYAGAVVADSPGAEVVVREWEGTVLA